MVAPGRHAKNRLWLGNLRLSPLHMPVNSRMRLLLGVIMLLLCGCGIRVPPVPALARQQVPRGAPQQAWRGQGRLEITYPGTRLSLDCRLRAPGDGSVRYVLLSDAGILLADVTVSAQAQTINQAVPDVKPRLDLISRLFGQAYARYPTEPARWKSERLVIANGKAKRWHGGDPILLRRIEGGGWPIAIGDYRPLGEEFLGHEVVAEGSWGSRVSFTLQAAKSE
jgi:hypothetical protein